MAVMGRRIPEGKLKEFKKPIGSPLEENDLKNIDAQNIIITVGDVVSLTLRKNGVIPRLSVYDGRTERRTMTEFATLVDELGEGRIEVTNVAGTVTCGMFDAVRNALSQKIGLIHVDGEEDMAVIPCILLSPEGTRIIYGQPGEGMMLITTSGIIKKRAEELWNMMEEFE